MANPTLLDMPIARDGNKNAIPTTDNGTTGLLSQQYGWQLINAIPPQQGGKAVKREDFNGALYLLSNLLFYLQKGWQFEWDANQNYYAGCIVKDPNNGKMYQRLNDGTSNTAPHSDTTNWKLWDLSMLANYLPLSGGTLTGNPTNIKMSINNSYLELKGGNTQGGVLKVIGSGNTVLQANDGINASEISMEPNLLKYNADLQNTPTTYWDLGGASIVAKSLGTNGYIKFASGLILQWGEIDGNNGFTHTDNGMSKQISLPISFTSQQSYSVVATIGQNSLYYSVFAVAYNYAADKITLSYNYPSALALEVRWLAIGY